MQLTDDEIRESTHRPIKANRRLSAVSWVVRDLAERADRVSRSQKVSWAMRELLEPLVRQHEQRTEVSDGDNGGQRQ